MPLICEYRWQSTGHLSPRLQTYAVTLDLVKVFWRKPCRELDMLFYVLTSSRNQSGGLVVHSSFIATQRISWLKYAKAHQIFRRVPNFGVKEQFVNLCSGPPICKRVGDFSQPLSATRSLSGPSAGFHNQGVAPGRQRIVSTSVCQYVSPNSSAHVS